MGYDHADSFPFDFEPNGIKFDSILNQMESKGKLSPRSYLIQFERKCKYSFLSEGASPQASNSRDEAIYRAATASNPWQLPCFLFIQTSKI